MDSLVTVADAYNENASSEIKNTQQVNLKINTAPSLFTLKHNKLFAPLDITTNACVCMEPKELSCEME